MNPMDRVRMVRAGMFATLGIAMLVMVMTSCSGCATTNQLRTVQGSHDSLVAAQDIEAQICWGVKSAVDPAIPDDTTKCTSDLAKTVGLTDERHKQLHAQLFRAFELHKTATTLIRNGKPADVSGINAAIVEILSLIAQLQPAPQVTQLKSSVEAGRIK